MDESALLPRHVAHYMLDTAWSAVRVISRSSLSAVTTDRTIGRGEGLGKSKIELRIASLDEAANLLLLPAAQFSYLTRVRLQVVL